MNILKILKINQSGWQVCWYQINCSEKMGANKIFVSSSWSSRCSVGSLSSCQVCRSLFWENDWVCLNILLTKTLYYPKEFPIVFIFCQDLKVCDRNGKNARFYLPGEHSVTKWGINVKTFVFIQNYRWEIYKTVITICSIKQTFALSFIYWKQCAGILFQS